jgi:BlaI family transcriptional regulator, penicillinase repressor
MTDRTRAKTRVRPPLTALEKDVMQAVWDKERCAVEGVHEIVSRKHNLKETSVRTILRRLEQKGYLRHEVENRAYVYLAAEPARSLAARAVRQIIDNFCRGSMEELVSGMVEAKVLTNSELGSLEEFVRSYKKRGK